MRKAPGMPNHWVRAALIPSTVSGFVVAIVLGMGYNLWMVRLNPEDMSMFRLQISRWCLSIIGVAGAVCGLLIACGYCLVVWVAERLLNRGPAATPEL